MKKSYDEVIHSHFPSLDYAQDRAHSGSICLVAVADEQARPVADAILLIPR